MKRLYFLGVILLSGCATSRVAKDLQEYDKVEAQMKAELQVGESNDKPWVKAKIKNMVKVDQYMRNYGDTPFKRNYSEDEKKEFQKAFLERFNNLDREDTKELKSLLKKYFWFSVSEFGAETDKDAWLLVQHADLDPDFQKEVLEKLTTLYEKHETDPTNYAYLYDRVAASFSDNSKRKPQRYGTQGSCVGPGKWEPIPIEDPDQLDRRRKQVGLGSEADYIKVFKDICH